MIWIRADANREIGVGHVMRCLSVAEALKKMGERVCFLTADESAVPLLARKGQEYRILYSDYTDPESELGSLEEMLREEAPRFFLADSYFVTAEYFRRVRRHVPVGYVDDKCLGGFPLDVLINYNIFAEESMYKEYEGTRLLLGTVYAPLREEFAAGGWKKDSAGVSQGQKKPAGGCRMQEEHAGAGRGQKKPAGGCRMQEEHAGAGRGQKEPAGGCRMQEEHTGVGQGRNEPVAGQRERVPRVLVTTGGSDKYHLSGKFLEKALAHRETAGLEYWVVSGTYNVYLDRLLEFEAVYPNVHVYSNVGNMAGLMRESDIAVTAGGSTMYELSAMGVPMLCFSFVDNQERIVKGFAEKGLVCFAGDYLAQGEEMFKEAVEKLALLARDRELRRFYSEKQRQVVDGRGASRIAEVLAGF